MPEDPVPNTKYYHSFEKRIHEGITRYQMLPEIFSKFI
jgi:hypothetical protein